MNISTKLLSVWMYNVLDNLPLHQALHPPGYQEVPDWLIGH